MFLAPPRPYRRFLWKMSLLLSAAILLVDAKFDETALRTMIVQTQVQHIVSVTGLSYKVRRYLEAMDSVIDLPHLTSVQLRPEEE